ncbi:MAG: transglutaminase family protein [Bdellovibrionales bacterium]
MTPGLRTLVRPLLYLVIFNLLPEIYLRPWWITVAALSMVGFRLWIEHTGYRIPPRWILITIQGLLCAAVWQQYQTFWGDESGGALLTILMCLKVYELKRARDFFITSILCVLVLMSYLLLDQGLSLTFFMLVDLVAIITFLFALQDEKWSWKIWRQATKPSIALALKSLPLVVLMFVLFPRFNTGFGHSGNSVGKTGVTDSLRPGSVEDLVNSDELIFRASFLDGNVPGPNQLYWRGAVLDKSNGLDWDRSRSAPRDAQPAMTLQSPDLEVYLEPGSDKFLFSPENTQTLAFPNASGLRVNSRDGKVYELADSLQTRERYYIKRGTPAPEDEDLSRFLQTGEKPSPELEKFLKKYQGKPTSEVIQSLQETFRGGDYHYSLKPPHSANLDEFMFKNKTGFCEHFAGAMGTILRDLNIPARVVVGFQGGTPSYFENYISVRGHDAHAWVEYFDSNAKRWRRVDPTAEVEPLRVSQGSNSYFEEGRNLMPSWMPAGWFRTYLKSRAFMDEVEANWTGFLLRFDLARQKELLAKLGMEEVLFRALGVFLLLSVGLILAVLYFFEAQRKEPLSPDEKIYRQLLNVLKKWNIHKTPQEGPLTLMAKIRAMNASLAEQVEPILAPLVRVRYGQGILSHTNVNELRKRLRLLRKFKI